MFDIGSIGAGASLLMEWHLFGMLLLGLLFGIVTGAIPGFSTPLAISVMLPLTFPMSPLVAIVFLTAVYAGGNFGASISAILLNIPGSPQAIMTGLEGYPMTQKGRAYEALGTSVAASATGNLVGSFFLILVMPLIVLLALKFGPPEMFLVGVLGLTIIASLDKSFLKAMIAGMFGVLISTTGMSSTGAIRGTFGYFELMDGISIIPALIGLIGFSELFYMLQKSHVTEKADGDMNVPGSALSQLLRGFRTAFAYPAALLRSCGLGVIIGALPGAGATISSVVSYNEAKRASATPEEFGKGAPEGLISAEAANNASEGGALALMLALGIPGGLATAVLIGALMLQGLIPGPRLFMEQPDLVYGVMLAQFVTSICLMGMGLLVSFWAAKIVRIPTQVLIPVISIFSIAGTYAVHLLMFDVVLMAIFAALGILLRRFDYPLIAVVLGIVLGPILDAELLRTYQTFGRIDLWIFLARPVSLVLLSLLGFSLVTTIIRVLRDRGRATP
ncbi:tripartite tricarboxylate transporter permease [Sulfitobacter sp. F26204]|uniref:tripartite tricarboxylate transporter permease n=1 Tax=Sulfitobacter sp. F26204 TaxID=2996014 RepID=UPI00225DFF12|nr:tripartite tricarboxylate transporter permease [Sulfitobacter sp. F26204]MCX7560617.1 tripartite tricarboxylate transporter permease [Sulfitobacter sp. F26204]